MALCEEQVETALHAGSALALGAAMERALGMLDSAWDVHYSTTSSLVPAGALQRKLGRRLLPAWDEVERLVNKPDELPWGRLFDASIDDAHFLRAPFYEVADAFEPWHGFAHAFTPQPAGDVPRPRATTSPRSCGRCTAGCARSASSSSRARSTTTCRRARRASRWRCARCTSSGGCCPRWPSEAGLDGDEWAYLRIRELLEPRFRGRLGELVETRRMECADALDVEMPDEYNVPLPAAPGRPRAPERPRARRTPTGVSPGLASGVVTTVEQAAAGVEHDEPVILVCESADACIQSLLPGSAGLITLRGSMLSHISTLAREYGIPAIVDHPLAATLEAGQQILLNGNTGEVEVLA